MYDSAEAIHIDSSISKYLHAKKISQHDNLCSYKKIALSQEQYNKLSDEEKEPLSYEDSPLDEYCGNLTLNYLTQLIDNNDIGSKMARYLIGNLNMLIIQLKLLKQGH